MTRTTTARVIFAVIATANMIFGYMGFCVAAMLHKSHPVANAIATWAAQHGTGTFLAWMASGMLSIVLLILAVRD